MYTEQFLTAYSAYSIWSWRAVFVSNPNTNDNNKADSVLCMKEIVENREQCNLFHEWTDECSHFSFSRYGRGARGARDFGKL